MKGKATRDAAKTGGALEKDSGHPVPGTQPEGVTGERAAAQYVRTMFGEIAPRYDLLNHLLSLSMDRLWRWRTARRFRSILQRPDAQVIDLCCGTGDLTLALERRARPAGSPAPARPRRILGADFAQPMLVRATAKAARARSGTKYLAADSLSLPFADASFDLVTAAFGFRNLANYQHGLEEIARVLKPGGELGILEFSAPRWWPMAPLYRYYFRRILPRIGGKISGSVGAYEYLPGSVAKFPGPEELAKWMQHAGFVDVKFETWTGGIVALHRGQRR
jgi:demethylmenaquinone methyltransferase / 2-methoxy-6-polyprenyl-1,4-benzoquinol methylase